MSDPCTSFWNKITTILLLKAKSDPWRLGHIFMSNMDAQGRGTRSLGLIYCSLYLPIEIIKSTFLSTSPSYFQVPNSLANKSISVGTINNSSRLKIAPPNLKTKTSLFRFTNPHHKISPIPQAYQSKTKRNTMFPHL